MQTSVKNPLNIFSMPQLLQVPVFQRRYVWDEESQWEPLWKDIESVAEAHLAGRSTTSHFLGAVVTQSAPSAMGEQPRHAIIDGQQRLTTLQLVFDATAAVVQSAGFNDLTQRLAFMTHNTAGGFGTESLKLHHENSDGETFRAVMLAEPPIDYSALPEGKMNSAHQYFAERSAEFIGDPADRMRAQALVDALSQGLLLVVISLEENEPAQEIFETLNARGTPLSAADLIKNFVFQQIAAEGGDPRVEYKRHWEPLETRYWETEVSVGRYSTPRLPIFLNHWLVARTAGEVSPRSTFTRFKSWFGAQDRSMGQVLASIHKQAMLYQSWEHRSYVQDGELEPEAMFVYRARAVGVEAVKPLLLWLYDVDRTLPTEVVEQALRDAESWMMRRALLQLPASESSRLVASMISEMSEGDPTEAADRLRRFLAAQNRPSTYWPGDPEMRKALATSEIYWQPRARVRTYLEAVEDFLRGYRPGTGNDLTFSGMRVRRGSLTIEHLMPQQWRSHWPTAEDADSIVDRDMHVHRLGNLTLLTQSLNSSLSNSGWLVGKRDALAKSDTLLLTRGPRELEVWDEAKIDQRGQQMIEALLATWATPSGHSPIPVRKVAERTDVRLDLRALVELGHVPPGTLLYSGWGDNPAQARVLADGRIEFDGKIYGSPSGAASAALGGGSINGWRYWCTVDGQELRRLRP